MYLEPTILFNFNTFPSHYRFAINDGEVTYQCRFIKTNAYTKNHAANRIVMNEFGTRAVPDPCKSIFER